MNLIQRGTTASRANRGKSVTNSIARSRDRGRYQGNTGERLSCGVHLENDKSTHLINLGNSKRKEMSLRKLS